MSLDFRKTLRALRVTGTTIGTAIMVIVALGAILATIAGIMSGSDNDLIQMEKWERLNPEPLPSPAGAPTT